MQTGSSQTASKDALQPLLHSFRTLQFVGCGIKRDVKKQAPGAQSQYAYHFHRPLCRRWYRWTVRVGSIFRILRGVWALRMDGVFPPGPHPGLWYLGKASAPVDTAHLDNNNHGDAPWGLFFWDCFNLW